MNAQKFLNELHHQESSTPPPQITLRSLVPHRYVSRLYNSNFVTINEINTKFGVKLYTVKGDGLRLMFINGSPRAISNAWGFLFSFFQHTIPLNYGETMGICFLVPEQLTDILQDNININNLQSVAKRSKTEIRLAKKSIPNTTEKILRISVPLIEDDLSKPFMKAVYLLAQNFQQHISVAYSPLNVYHVSEGRRVEYIQNDEEEIVYSLRRDMTTENWNNDFLK